MNEAQIYSILSPLSGGNVFPYVAPNGTQAPWLIFSFPTETGDDVFCGQSGFRSSTLQIDVYAKDIDTADEILRQAEIALEHLMPSSLLKTKGYEPDTGLRRATLEFQV